MPCALRGLHPRAGASPQGRGQLCAGTSRARPEPDAGRARERAEKDYYQFTWKPNFAILAPMTFNGRCQSVPNVLFSARTPSWLNRL